VLARWQSACGRLAGRQGHSTTISLGRVVVRAAHTVAQLRTPVWSCS
jgi:hypothetical protein